METIEILTSKNYRQLKGPFQNEIIRKVKQICPAPLRVIEDALFDAMPLVKYCHEYPELTRFANTQGAQNVFEKIHEYAQLEKYK